MIRKKFLDLGTHNNKLIATNNYLLVDLVIIFGEICKMFEMFPCFANRLETIV